MDLNEIFEQAKQKQEDKSIEQEKPITKPMIEDGRLVFETEESKLIKTSCF